MTGRPNTTETGGAVAKPEGNALSLAQAQESLILRHTHLSERLPIVKEAAEKATTELRALRQELEQIRRTLRHVDRVRSPRRRGVKS